VATGLHACRVRVVALMRVRVGNVQLAARESEKKAVRSLRHRLSGRASDLCSRPGPHLRPPKGTPPALARAGNFRLAGGCSVLFGDIPRLGTLGAVVLETQTPGGNTECWGNLDTWREHSCWGTSNHNRVSRAHFFLPSHHPCLAPTLGSLGIRPPDFRRPLLMAHTGFSVSQGHPSQIVGQMSTSYVIVCTWCKVEDWYPLDGLPFGGRDLVHAGVLNTPPGNRLGSVPSSSRAVRPVQPTERHERSPTRFEPMS
jgi:hypothetical protein